MKPRGSFDSSDYDWIGISKTAAYALMGEGADGRSLTLTELASRLQRDHRLAGDAKRAAFQIEEHPDNPERGWLLLAEYAVKGMLKAKVIEASDEGYRWTGDGRQQFTSFGHRIKLQTEKERTENELLARIEILGAGRPFQGLPQRTYDKEKMGAEERANYDELYRSIKTFGYDPNFPIIKDEDGNTISGKTRELICEELGIEPMVVTVRRGVFGEKPPVLSAPLRNVDDKLRAARANLARGMSKATRNALAQELRDAGVTLEEIAAALGLTKMRVSQVTEPMPRKEALHGTAEPTKVDDETAVQALMAIFREQPQIGRRAAATLLRDRHDWKIANDRIDQLAGIAKSRLAASEPLEPEPESEPEPEPEPEPQHEHVWVCSVCGVIAD